jgi:hypothetical protein
MVCIVASPSFALSTSAGDCIGAETVNWTSTTMVVIDLRRTCETMLASLGLQKDMRAQVQSRGIVGIQDKHTPDTTTCAKRRRRSACRKSFRRNC